MQDRDAGEDEKQFKLSRFMPVLQEVLEDLATNSLPEHEYPYVSAPASNGGAAHLLPTTSAPAIHLLSLVGQAGSWLHMLNAGLFRKLDMRQD